MKTGICSRYNRENSLYRKQYYYYNLLYYKRLESLILLLYYPMRFRNIPFAFCSELISSLCSTLPPLNQLPFFFPLLLKTKKGSELASRVSQSFDFRYDVNAARMRSVECSLKGECGRWYLVDASR